MKPLLRTALPYLVGLALLAVLSPEAALAWFMAYYLTLALRLIYLRRGRRPSLVDDTTIRVINLDGEH